jgi:hypothetical protein
MGIIITSNCVEHRPLFFGHYKPAVPSVDSSSIVSIGDFNEGPWGSRALKLFLRLNVVNACQHLSWLRPKSDTIWRVFAAVLWILQQLAIANLVSTEALWENWRGIKRWCRTLTLHGHSSDVEVGDTCFDTVLDTPIYPRTWVANPFNLCMVTVASEFCPLASSH